MTDRPENTKYLSHLISF